MDKSHTTITGSPQRNPPQKHKEGHMTLENSARLVYSTDPAAQKHIILPAGFEPLTDAAEEAKCSILGITRKT